METLYGTINKKITKDFDNTVMYGKVYTVDDKEKIVEKFNEFMTDFKGLLDNTLSVLMFTRHLISPMMGASESDNCISITIEPGSEYLQEVTDLDNPPETSQTSSLPEGLPMIIDLDRVTIHEYSPIACSGLGYAETGKLLLSIRFRLEYS